MDTDKRESSFNEAQIIAVLRGQKAGRVTAEVAAGMGSANGRSTAGRPSSRNAGFDAQKLETLEDENRRLKKLLVSRGFRSMRIAWRKRRRAAQGSFLSWC